MAARPELRLLRTVLTTEAPFAGCFFFVLPLLYYLNWSPDEVNATIGRLNAIGLSSLHLICHIIFKQRKSAVFFVSKMRVL